MTDTDPTTPVGIPAETETTRQGKGAAPPAAEAAPPAPPAAEAPAPPAKDDEPQGPPLEAQLVGEPLAMIEFAQGQSDGPILSPILTAIAKTSNVDLEDLHDKAKTHPTLRAAIEDVTSAFFRLAARFRNKGGKSLLVIGKNKDGQIVGSCEHEKGSRSSVLVLDVPVASADPAAAAPAKSSATGESQSAPAPAPIGVMAPGLARRVLGRR